MTPVSSRWFFLVLSLMGAASALIPWGYAAKRQITLNDFDQAKAAWISAGLLDYDLLVRHEAGPVTTESHVRIRGGQVSEVLRDGEFANFHAGELSVERMFAKLEFLLAARKSPDYLIADFHPDYGHPVRLVWRPREGCREEWVLKLDAARAR